LVPRFGSMQAVSVFRRQRWAAVPWFATRIYWYFTIMGGVLGDDFGRWRRFFGLTKLVYARKKTVRNVWLRKKIVSIDRNRLHLCDAGPWLLIPLRLIKHIFYHCIHIINIHIYNKLIYPNGYNSKATSKRRTTHFCECSAMGRKDTNWAFRHWLAAGLALPERSWFIFCS